MGRPHPALVGAALSAALLAIGLGRRPAMAARGSDMHPDRSSARRGQGRGRAADSPADIPAAGWKDILWRTYSQISIDRVMSVAAGVTFYSLLAIFPAMTALISLYGLFADPATVVSHVQALSAVLPADATSMLQQQMERIAGQASDNLSLGFIFGLAIALWSSNQGMKAVFDALNVAYGEREKRSFIRLNAITLLFTISTILFVILALGFIVVVPIVLDFVGLGAAADIAIKWLRWPVLLAAVMLGISILYRYGPSRERATWRWVTPGSTLAAVVWVIASILFSWYVANFGSYNETYGSLGAVIVFMTWMWVSATILLVGAELDAEIEHQTARDTTTGQPLPRGERGARMADTVGKSAAE